MLSVQFKLLGLTWEGMQIQRKTQVSLARATFLVRAAEIETAATSRSKGTNGTGGGEEGETYEVFLLSAHLSVPLRKRMTSLVLESCIQTL